MAKNQIIIAAPEDRKYTDDPSVKFEWFPLATKGSEEYIEKVADNVGEFMQGKECVAMETMTVRREGKVVGRGLAVYYRAPTA